METQILGNIIGGVIAGVVCGVFPLINGITKNQSRLALCGFFCKSCTWDNCRNIVSYTMRNDILFSN